VSARLGPDEHSVLLTVAYDGRPYAGFVLQDNAPSVAAELLRAIARFDAAVSELFAVSRTDRGVHAREQRVAFATRADMPPRAWVLGLQRELPRTIAVRRATIVRAGFDPRRRPSTKRYRYLLLRDRLHDPLLEGRAWRVWGIDSDEALARLESELLSAAGTHDFTAFASAHDTRRHRERTLGRLAVTPLADDPRLVAIDVGGTRFLHNMVRILVGTVVDVGRGRLAPGAVTRALASRDRADAGITAPPDGLYLDEARFDDEPEGPSWP
jgi:tRNA pseudouridine38-40 synthase